jgi:hypothetical protein
VIARASIQRRGRHHSTFLKRPSGPRSTPLRLMIVCSTSSPSDLVQIVERFALAEDIA